MTIHSFVLPTRSILYYPILLCNGGYSRGRSLLLYLIPNHYHYAITIYTSSMPAFAFLLCTEHGWKIKEFTT